jgi:hypothetical protein
MKWMQWWCQQLKQSINPVISVVDAVMGCADITLLNVTTA